MPSLRDVRALKKTGICHNGLDTISNFKNGVAHGRSYWILSFMSFENGKYYYKEFMNKGKRYGELLISFE